MGSVRAVVLASLFVMVLACGVRAADPPPATGPDLSRIRDPFKDLYASYVPDFLIKRDPKVHFDPAFWVREEKEMKLSTETTYFTLNVIDEDSRANALVLKALERESQGQYREALKMYQIVVDKFPNVLYRVSHHGVFVPISQYCQRRILGFPATELAFYRSLYDAKAKEAFEQARRQYSLIGLSEVVDTMLATSYGGKALLELGNAALDAGYHLAALEYFTTVRDFFPDPALKTPELALKIRHCQRMLGTAEKLGGTGAAKSSLSPDQLARLGTMVDSAKVTKPPFFSQFASGTNIAADDYTLMPPTTDPMGLTPPVWDQTLPGSRRDFFVYSQPVVTENSVIYRHKNIVYCRSILNGELRWSNDMGGRAVWQNWGERQYPQEDVLVQDGLVFTTISKAGPSLVALDEVTGQLKWAYGPMVASNEEEARMRFEAAPAGGPRTIYAGYVLDNIEGDTHTDSEYGVIAFDSATGRIHWRTALCRLNPGKFAAGFAEQRRNRIRSFTSPPLYHEGTVYYTTNAGAVAAIDSQSGRVRWLAHYPYHFKPENVHDATRQFGNLNALHGGNEMVRPHEPMFWVNQRPLIVGEQLYILPVDCPLMFAMDRRNGKINWSRRKMGPGFTYFLGPIANGQLLFVTNGRNGFVFGGGDAGAPVSLVDPITGKTAWEAPDLILHDDQPVMKDYIFATHAWFSINNRWFENACRPFVASDGKLYVATWTDVSVYWRPGCFVFHLVGLDLNDKKILFQRRYYTDTLLAHCEWMINTAIPPDLKLLEDLPAKDEKALENIRVYKEIMADKVPENKYGPFMPFSRITFSRYGVPFELRFGCREVGMVYDRAAVTKAIAGRSDPAADFARAELAVADSRFDEAATLLKKCLTTISSEDLDFRAAINQQLYRVHQRLARTAIRTGKIADELDNGLGMSRTCSTLAEEIETLFALSEAYERKGDLTAAARCLRTIIETYGRHEYPVSPLAVLDSQQVLAAAGTTLDRTSGFVGANLYGKELTGSLTLMKKGLPLYLSTVSPLPKTLTLRAGERAAAQLMRLQKLSPEFASQFETTAATALNGKPEAEQLQRIWEFPGTTSAQKTLDGLCAGAGKLEPVLARQRLWRLSDAARVCGLKMPPVSVSRAVPGPGVIPGPGGAGAGPEDGPAHDGSVTLPQDSRTFDFQDAEGSARLALQRGDDLSSHGELMFIGGRVRKRIDNKFILTCMDTKAASGEERKWETANIRLKGTGQEPGFFEAFVVGERVVVHGLYDVLAYSVADGKLAWSYRVPFDFEIKHAILSGDLLLLAGKTETLALYVPTENPNGEVAWQVGEMGDLYIAPYMRGDRFVSVRKLPFSVTVRYRATGQLIGRLDLPDLSLHMTHPLIEGGPEELPAAHCENLLAVTDGWYYVLVDTDKLAVAWKRLIDNNDVTREPAMRFALSPEYVCVLKEDYDKKAIYMLSAKTGEILWSHDPKVAGTPDPMHSMLIVGNTVYGIVPHAGQGFYVAAVECKTGKKLYRQENKDYAAKPKVALVNRLFGAYLAVQVEERLDVEVKVFDAKTGQLACQVKDKGVSPFGVHGNASSILQSGRVILLGKAKLQF